MKKSEIRKMIKEEIHLLNEGVKIKDITKAFEDSQEELNNAEKEREEARKRFNIAYNNASKEGTELGMEFMSELSKILRKELNVKNVKGQSRGASLMEFFVDGRRGKVSVHNRKYMGAYQNEISYMIRDEENLFAEKNSLDDNFDAKKASKFILDKVKKFEKKDNKMRDKATKSLEPIKWFK